MLTSIIEAKNYMHFKISVYIRRAGCLQNSLHRKD